MRNEQRVFILKMLQLLQHRIAFVRETVIPPPFQIPNLHGDLREFEGVGIQLDGFELLHIDAWLEFESQLRSKCDEFLFKVEKQLKRDVKEVAAAARRVEHG